jgi:hypothetical protein
VLVTAVEQIQSSRDVESDRGRGIFPRRRGVGHAGEVQHRIAPLGKLLRRGIADVEGNRVELVDTRAFAAARAHHRQDLVAAFAQKRREPRAQKARGSRHDEPQAGDLLM